MARQMQQAAAAPGLLGLLALVAAGAGPTAAAAAALSGAGAAVGARAAERALLLEPLPPQVSEFAQTIDERIERDSKIMGQVARHLQGLENSTMTVSEDVLEKVYDMHSVQGFLADHEAALREHEHLGQEIDRLTSLVDALSMEIEMVQNQTGQQDSAESTRQQASQAKEAEVTAIRSDLERRRFLAETNAALERANVLLEEQNIQAVQAMENMTKEIDSVKTNLSVQQNTTKDLEATILQQHHYAEECNRQAGHYESRLAEYDKLLDVIRGRGGRVMKVAEMTAKVHAVMMQKNAVLKARIDKAKGNTVTIQTQTYTTRAQRDALQRQAQVELAKMGKELGGHLAKEEAAKAELKTLIISKEAEERRLEVAKAEVEKLQKRLISGDIAKLHSNNTQLKAELQKAQETLQESQANLMRDQVVIAQANQTLASLRNASEDSLLRAQDVAKELLEHVVAAKQRDEAAAAEAKEAAMRAEAASLMDCNATWDQGHQSLLEELDRCAPLELELKTVRAQVEALTNTISASQAQEEVEG